MGMLDMQFQIAHVAGILNLPASPNLTEGLAHSFMLVRQWGGKQSDRVWRPTSHLSLS